MFGKVLWPAVVVAFLADLVVDWAFGNTVVNLVTFGVVFTVVALVRYSQRSGCTDRDLRRGMGTLGWLRGSG